MNYIGAGQHGGNTLRNGHDDGRTKRMTISRADSSHDGVHSSLSGLRIIQRRAYAAARFSQGMAAT
ncbi:hypothetical protein B2M20_11215 [Nitrobacter vulgaris]|uniref:Uncharacterized protein n=1 Tax=Nitrobacter vulgaris TaxID=29421 RepID=A0A1V4HYJ7_NITVU|nr:hypothetical protein B2M20_11215 [Nitrobacter vulgaris]